MEHQDALYRHPEAPSSVEAGTGEEVTDLPALRLVTAVYVTVAPLTFECVLHEAVG